MIDNLGVMFLEFATSSLTVYTQPELIDNLWLILLAFGAGTAGSMVGFGGGIMISPVLAFMGFNPALIASSALSGTFGNLSGATITHAIRKKMKYSLGIKLGLLSIPGTAIGAIAANHIESDLFNVMLGIILAISAFILIRGKMKEGKKQPMRFITVVMVLASMAAGVVSSFFGIGGGVIIVPFMILVLGMKIKEVAILSQPALLVIAFVGLVVHGTIGHLDMYLAIFLLVGGFCGGLVGVRLSTRLKGRQMQIILSALIFSAAARLIWGYIEETYFVGLVIVSKILSN